MIHVKLIVRREQNIIGDGDLLVGRGSRNNVFELQKRGCGVLVLILVIATVGAAVARQGRLTGLYYTTILSFKRLQQDK